MVIADRARRDAEQVIRALYEITSEFEQGLDHQLQRLLALGCHRLGVEVGIVASVADGVYRIVQVNAPPRLKLAVDQTLALGDTYCSVTLERGELVATEDVSGFDELRDHPAHARLGLEAYAGVPLFAGGALYGALEFFSRTRRPRRFSDADLDCVRLMSTWVGTEIHRRTTEDALRRATAELERLTNIDPLTQLLNRRGLERQIPRVVQRCERDGSTAIGLLVDLDDFKSVNDVHGYEAGDLTLMAAAHAIESSVRPADLVGRIGGDEFLAVLAGATLDQGRAAAERIRRTIAADDRCRTTASISVAVIDPSAMEIRDVVRMTNAGLKSAKLSGKNIIIT